MIQTPTWKSAAPVEKQIYNTSYSLVQIPL